MGRFHPALQSVQIIWLNRYECLHFLFIMQVSVSIINTNFLTSVIFVMSLNLPVNMVKVGGLVVSEIRQIHFSRSMCPLLCNLHHID